MMAVNKLTDVVAALEAFEQEHDTPFLNGVYSKTDIAPPFIALQAAGASTYHADGFNYTQLMEYDLELYCTRREYQLEKALQSVFDALEIAYGKSVYIIASENLTETVYTFFVIED